MSDTETTPFLTPDSNPTPKPQRNKKWLLLLICIIVLTVDFGSYLSNTPRTQILEWIICRNLHPDQFAQLIIPARDALCKNPEVQSELATINGWADTFDQIPGIVLALPYGLLADRVGRKRVLVLSLGGMVLQEVVIRVICWYNTVFPPRAIWFTSLIQTFGGGNEIAGSMGFTIVTDIFPAERRANIFFVLIATNILAEVLSASLNAWLMSWEPALPFLLGLVCMILGLLAAMALPETMPKHAEQDESRPLLESQTSRTLLDRAKSEIFLLTRFIWGRTEMIAVSVAFLATTIAKQAYQLVVQYVSVRFGWSMAKASYLISIRGSVNLITLLLILPYLSQSLERHLTPLTKDLRISQASAAVLVLGFTLISLAPNPASFITGLAISAFGWGFYASLRSVASLLVEESQMATLNTSIALVQGIGFMLAGPLFAGGFKYGMELGGVWVGLPFMIGGVLFLVAGLVTGVRMEMEMVDAML